MDNDMLPTIQKLLLADLMITIGQIRSKFNSFQTFYGTIEVNGQSMLDKGENLRPSKISKNSKTFHLENSFTLLRVD